MQCKGSCLCLRVIDHLLLKRKVFIVDCRERMVAVRFAQPMTKNNFSWIGSRVEIFKITYMIRANILYVSHTHKTPHDRVAWPFRTCICFVTRLPRPLLPMNQTTKIVGQLRSVRWLGWTKTKCQLLSHQSLHETIGTSPSHRFGDLRTYGRRRVLLKDVLHHKKKANDSNLIAP